MVVLTDLSQYRERLVSFIAPYEKYCVALMSHVLCADVPVYIISNASEEICGVFTISCGGQIHHCLPVTGPGMRNEMMTALTDFFNRNSSSVRLFCVAGEESGTSLITEAAAKAFDRCLLYTQKYLLMEHDCASLPDRILPADTAIVRATASLVDEVFPLQKAFEEEEVLFPGRLFNAAATRLLLERNLKTQYVYLLEKNGRVIAKAGTNAVGRQYVQYGGVYTVRSERGSGYASLLISHLVWEFSARGKKSVLFVKQKNIPAVSLYQENGFKVIGNYMICYY